MLCAFLCFIFEDTNFFFSLSRTWWPEAGFLPSRTFKEPPNSRKGYCLQKNKADTSFSLLVFIALCSRELVFFSISHSIWVGVCELVDLFPPLNGSEVNPLESSWS